MAEKKEITHAVLAVEGIVEREDGKILISRRARDPQKGRWGFNGTYVHAKYNNLEEQVIDQVQEETGLEVEIVDMVDVIDGPWLEHSYEDATVQIVQIVYRVRPVGGELRATEHADKHAWVSPWMLLLKRIAFNHKKILDVYKEKKANNAFLSVDRTKCADCYEQTIGYNDPDHVYYIAKSIILNEKQEILLAHRAQEPYLDCWDFPGGRMKAYETIEQALKREISEELGVEATIGELFNVYSDKGANPQFPRVMGLYFTDIHSTIFNKNVEMDDFGWFSLDALPEKLAFKIEGPLQDLKARLSSNS